MAEIFTLLITILFVRLRGLVVSAIIRLLQLCILVHFTKKNLLKPVESMTFPNAGTFFCAHYLLWMDSSVYTPGICQTGHIMIEFKLVTDEHNKICFDGGPVSSLLLDILPTKEWYGQKIVGKLSGQGRGLLSHARFHTSSLWRADGSSKWFTCAVVFIQALLWSKCILIVNCQ